MENEIRNFQLEKALNIELQKAGFSDQEAENIIEKARSGVYKDTIENRKLGRVGQKFGSKKQAENKTTESAGDSHLPERYRGHKPSEYYKNWGETYKKLVETGNNEEGERDHESAAVQAVLNGGDNVHQNVKAVFDHSGMSEDDFKEKTSKIVRGENFNNGASFHIHSVIKDALKLPKQIGDSSGDKKPEEPKNKKPELDAVAKHFIDIISISDSKIKTLDGITVHKTDKGNWAVFRDGKSLLTVGKHSLDDKTVEKYGIKHNFK